MERYSVIREKAKREIVLLRGNGCAYKKCVFCDYHTDSCPDTAQNFAINREALRRVTGLYGDLEVINSGSVFELDDATLRLTERICREKNIGTLHFESHWLYRDKIPALRARFDGIRLKMKLGLETFDYDLRETVLHKGIQERDEATVAAHFDEANFLFGITGQTVQSMRYDIERGLSLFERICVNIMCPNSTPIRPDENVIAQFVQEIYPQYEHNDRVDILLQNTDFGVGA